ncbi:MULTISPECIES: beta-N-acetylglucosaminidase domain-containing protein [Marinobacter]|uniref:Beta-N-acetylglucosaminidase n=1 Tax=Marinobacter segnicrescens TaxID=430453 RepID=A0A1I0FH30_9GAMM|nr:MULTISPECIES: beta-N-acetylglucosaminidase domain-containing protein [Marinobacter]UZD65236.1 protein O-GlcNAcase [Marinobacter sp. AN1]SET56830.1 beta-N-acetylglucosaminidase [Marinobacter segnicrescens]
MVPDLGIMEGFYGPMWQWADRRELMALLQPHGYNFYWYAPKADRYLRRAWQEPHPPEAAEAIDGFARWCDNKGIAFGVGLSPWEVFNQFDGVARRALSDKLSFLESVGVSRLAILFDDMKADTPDLALRQGEIIDWISQRTGFRQLAVCPSYYSDDSVLDRVFGQRPSGYLEDLGRALDPDVDIFWTGEEVCSREISPGHLRRVAGQLGRKPTLWDNYPVNDGDRMSRHLHLRGFTGRPAANAGLVSGHAINPALQPQLTAIPALTLALSYQRGEDYCYGEAFREAARTVVGEAMAQQLLADLLVLQDTGLHRIGPERLTFLNEAYRSYDQPAAREILRWLAGEYQVTDEMVQTQ